VPRLLLIDIGTTNTRVWRVESGRVVLRLDRAIGVRDTASSGSPARLHAELRAALAEASGDDIDGIVAAGMATSPLGIASAGHVHAPATLETVAGGCQWTTMCSVSERPILLVPGVRTHGSSRVHGSMGSAADASAGASTATGATEAALTSDVMRGEETLAFGLMAGGTLGADDVLLTFGSHWKAIGIDAQQRIGWSRTTLTGELFDAVRTAKVLASSLPDAPPEDVDDGWCEAGASACARHGLARALFGIRLLDQMAGASVPQRYAYALGALAADALPALVTDDVRARATRIVMTGHAAACRAVGQLLVRRHAHLGARIQIVSPTDVEHAWITGALAIWSQFRQNRARP
jgi:2-dehydro-3-deoxygalactonokinase